MADFQALIRAGRVIEGTKMTAATDIEECGAACSIFVAPISADLSVGDIIYVQGDLPFSSGAIMPVVVGDWSPVLWQRIRDFVTANSDSLTLGTDIRVFYAPARVD